MAGGYLIPHDGWGALVASLDDLRKRVSELERPTGSQTAKALATLTALVNGLINQTNINATGTATIGGDVTSTGGTFWSLYALNNPVATGYFALYVNSDGRFGRTVSARRYKQDIANFSPSTQAVFAMQLREFRLKQAVEEIGDAAALEYGLIAEELVECGLSWLVQFGADGQAESVAYEKVALALIPAIQDHERRLRAAGL